MRLTPDERRIITAAVAARDPQAQVWLFGSRADDAKRGGDIDLLVVSEAVGPREKAAIWWELQEMLGEQKIDIVLAGEASPSFVELVMEKAVRL